MSFGGAGVGTAGALRLEFGVVDRNLFAPVHLQALGVAAQVDRITAAALSLAADRAVATLVRVGVGAVQAEGDSAAVAGPF